jgi:hypothetical protein
MFVSRKPCFPHIHVSRATYKEGQREYATCRKKFPRVRSRCFISFISWRKASISIGKENFIPPFQTPCDVREKLDSFKIRMKFIQSNQALNTTVAMYSMHGAWIHIHSRDMKRKQCMMRWDDGWLDGGQLVLLAVACRLGRLQDSNHDGDAPSAGSGMQLWWDEMMDDCIACHPCIQSRYAPLFSSPVLTKFHYKKKDFPSHQNIGKCMKY